AREDPLRGRRSKPSTRRAALLLERDSPPVVRDCGPSERYQLLLLPPQDRVDRLGARRVIGRAGGLVDRRGPFLAGFRLHQLLVERLEELPPALLGEEGLQP